MSPLPTQLRPSEPLVVVGSGAEVHFYGKVFRFRGTKQRAIIQYLHNRYLASERAVNLAAMAEDLGLGAKPRLRDFFKTDQSVMEELLYEKSGVCGFRFDAQEIL